MRRRHFIKGGIATLGVGLYAGNVAATGGSSEFTAIGLNKFDADGDGDIGLYFRPAKGQVGGRAGVRHFTSEGDAVGDYLTSVQAIPPTDIGEFTGDDPTPLEYDYYDTEDNEAATPDEVWVRVRDEGETRSFRRTSNDNDEGGSVGEWLTREIHNEIVGEPQYNSGFKWFEVGGGASDVSLVDIVGEDATLIHVGTGGSNYGGSVVTEFYIGKLRLDGHPVGQFPVEGNQNGKGNGNGRGR